MSDIHTCTSYQLKADKRCGFRVVGSHFAWRWVASSAWQRISCRPPVTRLVVVYDSSREALGRFFASLAAPAVGMWITSRLHSRFRLFSKKV